MFATKLLAPQKVNRNMKKVLVFAATIQLSLTKQTGIMKKVFAQASAFESFFDVYMWGFARNEIVYYHKGEIVSVTHFSSKVDRRIKYFKFLTDFTIKNKAFSFYFRYASTDFFLLNTLRKLKKNGIINLIEIPTYPYKGEYKETFKNRLIYLLDSLLRFRLKKYVSRVIIFSENPKIVYGIPTINTMNGVDASSIKPIAICTPHNCINLIAVASMLPHHGFDRLIEGLRVYYSNRYNDEIVSFHVVGDGPKLKEYKDLCKKYNIEQYVIFHGQKSGNDLDVVFEQSDIAVGSLGLHRIGINEGSTLKNREYAVRGLPIIYSTFDSFLKDSRFCVIFPPDDNPIDISRIVVFWKSIKETPNLHKIIRDEAIKKCDMKITMSPVMNYYKSLLENTFE